jgi:hypothetical protein
LLAVVVDASLVMRWRNGQSLFERAQRQASERIADLEARLGEEELGVEGAAQKTGQPVELVRSLARKVYLAEYKRQQFAPTLKVSPRAWVGRDPPPLDRGWSYVPLLNPRRSPGRAACCVCRMLRSVRQVVEHYAASWRFLVQEGAAPAGPGCRLAPLHSRRKVGAW